MALISKIILDNLKGLSINIPLVLNEHNDLEGIDKHLQKYSEEIYELYRTAYLSNDYNIIITLINYDENKIGSKQFKLPNIDYIMYNSSRQHNYSLYNFIINCIVDILDYKYILCWGPNTRVLYRDNLEIYEGNIKDIYGKLYTFSRKTVCDLKTKEIINNLYPDLKIVKFNFFCPKGDII